MRHKEKHRIRRFLACGMLLVILATIGFLGYAYTIVTPLIREFALENNILITQWTKELVALLDKNPETKDFVLNYPLKKDASPEIDLSECIDTDDVPLLFQWDQRWGYDQYAGELMGLSGCGPTCLSMVCLYLLDDPIYTPQYVAEFAKENGYSVDGNGSAWTLISKGGIELGLDVAEIPLDENRIIRNLEVGNPIICVVGPGDFTSTGHFIIMTGYEDGFVSVNDPNSNTRSEQLWDLKSVMSQIRNLWVCRA